MPQYLLHDKILLSATGSTLYMLHTKNDRQTEKHFSELHNHKINPVEDKLQNMPAKLIPKSSHWIDPAALTTLVFFIFFIAIVYLNAKS